MAVCVCVCVLCVTVCCVHLSVCMYVYMYSMYVFTNGIITSDKKPYNKSKSNLPVAKKTSA